MAGLQLVEPKDADYLAQRFGARPYDRISLGGRETFISEGDGAIGMAQGVRHLSLGQGLCSSWTYIFGGSDRWVRGGDSHKCFSYAAATMEDLRRRWTTLQPRTGLACQVVLRAPSDGMLAEYAGSISRLLTLTLNWLEWDPPIYSLLQHTTAATAESCLACDKSMSSCPVVAGGGASEVSLHLLFKDLADRCAMRGFTPSHVVTNQIPQKLGDSKTLSATVRRKDTKEDVHGSQPTQHRKGPDYHDGRATRLVDTNTYKPNADVDCSSQAGGSAGDWSISAAFSVLAAAMSVLPDTLLENTFATGSHSTASGGRNRSPGGGTATGGRCRFQFRHILDRLHYIEGQKSTGLVVTASGVHDDLVSATSGEAGLSSHCASERIGKGIPHLSFSCGLKADVVQPLTVKYGTLVALLETMTTVLRVGGVVRCRRVLGRAASPCVGAKIRRVEGNQGDSSDDLHK